MAFASAAIRDRRRAIGWSEIFVNALAASPLFDRDWYLAMNPDVAVAGADPWRHYLRHGAAEGRDPNPLFDGY